MSSKDNLENEKKTPEVDFYAILNVNKGATQAEINERHRALSLVFHPDKQRNQNSVEAATEEFLKVQKAYQVLSDPFLRDVYDILGERGLSIRWPVEFTSKGREEVRRELKRIRREGSIDEEFDGETPPKNSLAVTIDARALFQSEDALEDDEELPDDEEDPEGEEDDEGHHPDDEEQYIEERVAASPLSRLKHIHILSEQLTHTFTKRVNPKTTVSYETTGVVQGRRLGLVQYVGTVRHQFSPRFSGKAIVVYGSDLVTSFAGSYRDDYNTLKGNVALGPTSLQQPPTAEITYERRLWHSRPQRARITLNLQQVPVLSFNYQSPPSVTDDLIEANTHGLPSRSGLRYILFDKSVGVVFIGLIPKLVCEAGVSLIELSTRIKAGVEYGLGTGLAATIGARWSPEDGREAQVSTTVSSRGVVFQITFTLWKQQFAIPVFFASEYDPGLALFSVVIPSAAAVLGYHFIVRPRRRAQRIAQIRAARQVLEEDSDARKKRNTVLDLLRDSARRAMSAEKEKGGLVIEHATYGVIDTEDGAHDLTIDVTVPLQALVRNSHLYIPGDASKSDLQGFSDPAPFTAKSLRIRYQFCGRSYYAEIPDYLPVVLPLSEHKRHDH